MKNIFLTGPPRVGKTTLIKKLVEKLKSELEAKGKQLLGFYTEEIKRGGSREGFKLTTLDGKEGILAHINISSPYRVGKYRVDIDSFEKVVIPILDQALINKEIFVVIDEIGKMELFSSKFREKLGLLLNAPNLLLATLGQISDPLVYQMREREDALIFKVTLQNRDQIGLEITDLIRKLGSERG